MEGKKDETRPTSDSSTVKRTSPAKMCVYVLTFFFLKKKVKKRWRSQFHNLIAPWPRPPLCVRLESNSPHTFTTCLTYWDGLVPLQHSEIIIALHTGTIMLYKRVWVAPFECEWYCFSRPPFPFWIRASLFAIAASQLPQDKTSSSCVVRQLPPCGRWLPSSSYKFNILNIKI